MTEWNNIIVVYEKNIVNLDILLANKDWKNLNYKNLCELRNEVGDLIKSLNKNKRDFLEHYLLATLAEDKKNAGDFFAACGNKVDTYKSELLEPLIEKISEERDKRLYKRGIFYGAIIGILSSIVIQLSYDFIKKEITKDTYKKQNLELINKIESIIRSNNAQLLDSLKLLESKKLRVEKKTKLIENNPDK